MSVVDVVEILKGRKLSDDENFQAAVLGWSFELQVVSSSCHSLSDLTFLFFFKIRFFLVASLLPRRR